MPAEPRFDRPAFSLPAGPLLASAGVTIAEQQPMPTLIEPELPPVTAPVDEPLVPVVHRRIRTLSNYWHAGWRCARPDTLLRAGAMDALAAAADSLPERWGLAVFDAWRPLDLQAELYDAAYGHPGLPPGFVAEPIDDPALPPPHLSGGTVDLTLTFDGHPLALGTDFDGFTSEAAAMGLEHTPGAERELRRMLFWAMRGAGFRLMTFEWWHFELGTRRWAGITGNAPYYGPAHTG